MKAFLLKKSKRKAFQKLLLLYISYDRLLLGIQTSQALVSYSVYAKIRNPLGRKRTQRAQSIHSIIDIKCLEFYIETKSFFKRKDLHKKHIQNKLLMSQWTLYFRDVSVLNCWVMEDVNETLFLRNFLYGLH